MHFSQLRYLRIADLELFVSASLFNSLGKAAIQHHLSQSAASAAILRVENAVGKPPCYYMRNHRKCSH
ncbi:MAG: LysR family transcriptional regulator [Chlamydiales bacterium]|nr:LysR family transcriptional regulator [Chlamydiales bacterium]